MSKKLIISLLFPVVILASCGQPQQSVPEPVATEAPVIEDAELVTEATDFEAQSGSKLTDRVARQRITAAGISVSSSGNCSDRNKGTCTSLEQINSGTVSGVIAFKKAVSASCEVVITAGTEDGHEGKKTSKGKTHWNGYKLDLRTTNCVNNYIQKHYKYIGKRDDGSPQYQDSKKNIFALEHKNKPREHWDVLFP